jgi:hypothetical protein
MSTLQTVGGHPQTWSELMRRNTEFHRTRDPDGYDWPRDYNYGPHGNVSARCSESWMSSHAWCTGRRVGKHWRAACECECHAQ